MFLVIFLAESAWKNRLGHVGRVVGGFRQENSLGASLIFGNFLSRIRREKSFWICLGLWGPHLAYAPGGFWE